MIWISFTSISVITTFGNYDKYGNPEAKSVKAGDVTRYSFMTYTSSGRFLKSLRNRFNDTTSYTYDESRGLMKTKTDRIGTTTFDYDNFGRLKLTTYPDNTKSVNVLQWAGNMP